MRTRSISVLTLGLLLWLALPSWTQVTTGTITGIVRDNAGAVVPEAKVTITNLDKGSSQVYQTGQDGNYNAPFLIPGTYQVSVEKGGFRSEIRKGITLQVDQRARIDFTLSLGAVTQEITVTSAAPLVESQSSSLGQVIAQAPVEQLPLNGRDFAQLVYLAPGITPGQVGEDIAGNSTFNPRGTSSFNALGSQANGNAWLIDGIVNNEYTFNTTIVKPSVESIQEFKVLTGTFSAEFGRGPGVVSVSTRSGSNQFHGSAMDFLRNTVLNSRNYFAAPGQPKPPFIRNQYEATFGGPVIIPKIYNGHNHTFAFLDYYGDRQIQGLSYVNTVPTAAVRTGDFSNYRDTSGNLIPIYNPLTTTLVNGQPVRQQFPGNIIPSSLLNPVGVRVASIYPLPNAPGNFDNFYDTANRTIQDDGGNVRVDHVFGQKDTFFARYSYEAYRLIAPQGETSCCLPSNPSQAQLYDLGPWVAGFQNTKVNASGLSINETHIFAPNLVNEFRTGFARSNSYTVPSDFGHDAATGLGIQNINISQYTSGIPNLHIENFTGLGGGPDWLPTHPIDTEIQLEDGLSWVKGRHQLKFGFRGVREFAMPYTNSETRGDIYFNDNFTNNSLDPSAEAGSGLATLLLGYSTSGQRGFLLTPFYLTAYQWSGYVQDDWKVNSRLTLNLGARYDIFTPPTEKYNRLANFDPSTDTLLYAGVNGVSRTAGVQTRYNNLAPRVGFAYDPSGNGKTVIRGGYAIVYFPLPLSASNELGEQVPYIVSQAYTPSPYPTGAEMASIPTIANPFGLPTTVQPVTTTQLNAANPYVLGQAFANQTPSMQTYTFNIQHQIASSLLLQVGYAGSHGSHLLESFNINEVEPGSGSLASRRLIQPLNNVSNIYYMFPGNSSNYNSLQVRAEKRMANGLQFLVSYTWSKSLDYNVNEASGGGYVYSPQTYTNQKAGYGLSGFDLEHRFVASWVYDLPFGAGRRFATNGFLSRIVGGWELDGIGTLQSGYPFSVSLANGVNNGATSWPNQICPGQLPNPDPSAWFNLSCFVAPPANTYGNVSRTPLRGPGEVDFDMALAKSTTIKERWKLQFRAEAFNIFNHPIFSLGTNPDWGLIGLPDANVITGTAVDNREFQLSLKLIF